MKSLTLFNQPIRIGEDGMICLTDMWKASGKSESESPYHYLRNKQTKEFLAELEKNHESVESVVFTERGTTNLWFLRNAVYTVEHMEESLLLMITQHG
ncbi:phage KilA [Salmonella enterica subsp. enterica serovar Rubislaw str. A4-653]|uniref:Phage KilA n=1 Tax=Salmonella enterica subsp. enterica serovar Rubislaw str. A4-653 TaxID=913081 RepID=G5QFR0_SALRU|nr:phage KilA [Salmonella enterica subsp. enterica serovar Rubislaw str. A4-653]